MYVVVHEVMQAQDYITGPTDICLQGARRASAPKPGSEAAQKLEEEQAKQQPLRQYLDSRYNLPTELGLGPSTGAASRTSRMSAYSYSAWHIRQVMLQSLHVCNAKTLEASQKRVRASIHLGHLALLRAGLNLRAQLPTL